MIVDQYGVAVGRVPDDATAFGHRRSAFAVIVIAMWDDPAQEEAHGGDRRHYRCYQPVPCH